MKDLDPEARFVLPAPPAPTMPPGLVGLMEDLSRSVLRNDPEDIYAFCAGHMSKLLAIRDGEDDMKDLDPEARFVLPAPPAPTMPPGLVGLMEDLSRSVLRNDPEDIYAFCAGHMSKLLAIRDGEDVETKKALEIKIANAIAKIHKKTEKRRAFYDQMLAESVFERSKEQAGQDKEEEEDKLKGDSEKSVFIRPETAKLSQTLVFNDEQALQEETKSEDQTRDNLAEMEKVTSTVDEQSLNKHENTNETKVSKEKSEYETRQDSVQSKEVISTAEEQPPKKGDYTIMETISALEQPKNELGIAIIDDEELHKLNDKEQISFDQGALKINNQETSERNKNHEKLEEVKRTVCDAIAEIETAAIKTVTDLTLNLSKNMEINSVVPKFISQENLDNLVSTDYTDTNDKNIIKHASEPENAKNEVTLSEQSSTEEQTLNETKAEINEPPALEEIIHSSDAIKSIGEINKTLLEPKERLTMLLEDPQEEIEAALNENKADLNQATVTAENIHLKKPISVLEDIAEEFLNKVPLPNESVDGNVINIKKEEPSIEIDVPNEWSIRNDSNITTEGKDLIKNSIYVDSELNPLIKQEDVKNHGEITEITTTDDSLPIITEETSNINCVENDNQKVKAVNKVENSQNISVGVFVESENAKSSQVKPATSILINESPTQNLPITTEFLNKIKRTVSENKPDIIDNASNGEEDNTNYDLSNSERSPRSLKSNDSDDKDDITNGVSAENSAKADNSHSSASTTMNLETAAVTIQKVFRSFLFKSRASTLDDETPLDIPYLPDAIQDSDATENIAKVEEEPRITLSKERRNLGLSRMDTVLQTVNEEKSLSLSDDSSTLSSAATIIQAHVRGYLVRNKLTSRSDSSNKSNTQSELENEQQKKTVLNIHIVPEGSHFMSRDESLTHSLDLPLDITSPPSLTSYHSLGYDITERRKLLKREDAIQSSISPPSTNSGKSIEVPITSNDIEQPEIEDEQATFEDKFESEEVKESEISGDTTPTVSTTAETVIEINKEMELTLEGKESEIKLNSDEFEDAHLSTSPEKDATPESQSSVHTGILHSGEFHDVVLPPQPTQLSRDDPKQVARGE